MGLETKILVAALNRYKAQHRHGSWTELARRTGISSQAFSKIASDKVVPSLGTWEALHLALPEDFPPPRFSGPVDVDKAPELAEPAVESARVPVFDAGAGEPSLFTDGGHPVGFSSEYVTVLGKIDENTFGVKIHGDSMTPHLNEGDIAIVVPSAKLAQAKLCFATWPGELGKRLVKRYFRYGDTIVLRSDNPTHPEITLTPENGRDIRIYRITQTIRYE
ncbi:MAG: LexA family transcriptional regulator [Thermodesulfobacteriota bacterium]